MTGSPPLISIIIAVYNAESSIRKTIQSALAQTYQNIELVLIDGKSTDGTWAVIQEYAGSIDFKVSEKDAGIADAYNKGINAAKGEWLYFLNADDVFASDTVLAELFTGRDISPDTTVLAGTVRATDGRLFDGRFDWKLLIRNQVHHQAIFYRSHFLKAFPYNANYRSYGHDHEHNIFIWRRKERVEYVPKVVALWARGGISDKASWSQYREEFKVRRNSVGRYGYLFNVFSLIRFAGKRLRQT